MRRRRPSQRRAHGRDQNRENEYLDDRQMATPAEIEAAYQAVAGDEETDAAVDEAQTAADEPMDESSGDYNTDEFDAFVPVGRNEYRTYSTADDAADAPRDEDAAQPRVPRAALSMGVQSDVLMVALALIAAGIFGTLLVRGDVAENIREWWPLALVGASMVWMLFALLRRHVAGFLGAAAFAGVGLSLLMDTQDIAHVEETLLGVVLITAGLGIAVRGLLLRQRTAYN